MRDHFDPLAPLLYQNHDHPNPHHGNHSQMQGQGQVQVHHHQFQQQPSKAVRSSVHNPFGTGFSNNMAAGFSAVAVAVAVAPGSFVGEKRTNSSSSNSDENNNLDCCNLLQSSLKRVRLSRSPGEFRLQRDLKTLDVTLWGSSHGSANALNFSATTWIHRATGARLSMVDSLRICLFLPITAVQQQQTSGQQHSNSNSTTGVNPEQQYQHQLHSYHRDYRWRIMIQIPRMYPHSPPVVTRIDGLSLDSIAINELSPMGAQQQHESRNDKRKNHKSSTIISDGASSVHSTSGVTASESFFYTEAQLVRSTLSRTMTSSESQNTTSAPPMVGGSGKTIEWNQWSPITDLGELLDFLLGVAISNPSATTTTTMMNMNMNAGLGSTTTAIATTTSMMRTKSCSDDFNPSMAVRTARMSSSSSSSLSSISSASSISSWGNRNSNNSNNHDSNTNRPALSLLHRGGNNTVAETMMSDENENATTTSNITNVSGASFLSPNRFDVGYGKSGVGQQQQQQQQRTTPFTTNASTTWQQPQPPPPLHYGEKQGEDDVGMDMS